MDYRILLVDEDQDRMYVGCKDHVLSMDINNITQGLLKVRVLSLRCQSCSPAAPLNKPLLLRFGWLG